MARIVKAKNVKVGADFKCVNDQIVMVGGRVVPEIPVLYDSNGNYVVPVNTWFLHLAQELKDLSSYSRALRKYWTFLEEENLPWDQFYMPKNYKPTYRWRNQLKSAADKGEGAYSTAATYVCHVVSFYKFAMDNGMLIVSEDKYGPFTFEYVQILKRY